MGVLNQHAVESGIAIQTSFVDGARRNARNGERGARRSGQSLDVHDADERAWNTEERMDGVTSVHRRSPVEITMRVLSSTRYHRTIVKTLVYNSGSLERQRCP